MAEIVVNGNRFDDERDSLGAECGNTASHHGCAFTEVLSELVV